MEAEVEAKFLADGPEPLERLTAADRLGRASLGPPRVFDEVDRYLDTDDGRLAAAGWACRLRERDGRFRVSLKGPSVAQRESWLHHRPEVEGPATDAFDPRAWPDSEARRLVEQLSGGLPLNGITRIAVKTWANQLRTWRSERTVVDVLRLLPRRENDDGNALQLRIRAHLA